VGFITAVPARIRGYSGPDDQRDGVPMVEINFLCVHKKLRAKRLAPVLIKVRGHQLGSRCTLQHVSAESREHPGRPLPGTGGSSPDADGNAVDVSRHRVLQCSNIRCICCSSSLCVQNGAEHG